MIGTPVIVGYLTSNVSQSSYEVPANIPVPPGTVVTIFSGASGSAVTTGVSDSQGNDYGIATSTTTDQWLQSFTGTALNGLNELAGDYWTVTFNAASTQTKNIIIVALPGCSPLDVAASPTGYSTGPAASATTTYGDEVALVCLQNANAGDAPTFAAPIAVLGSLSGPAQSTYVGWKIVGQTGTVAVSAAIDLATWSFALLTFPAVAPGALGNQASPSGGAQLPPFPVIPSPRTWSQGDMLLTPWLRADPGNALALLANPPLVIAGQTITTQSIPNAAVTTLALDTELTDAWGSHAVPARQVYPPLPGWYLAEGHAFINDTTTRTVATAGIEVVNSGVAYAADGGKVVSNGTNFPIPTVCDLVPVNPATDDSVSLYAWQNSGAPAPIASAWLKTEWVCAGTGSPVSPVPAAGWTTGGTTLLQAAGVGSGAIIVEDPTGIVTGGVVCLDSGNAAAENVTVTAVAGQTVGITDCLYPHPQYAPVAVPVSAAFMNQQVRDKIKFLAYRPIARLSNQGGSQGVLSQAWPAGTAIIWQPPTSSIRCVDNWSGWDSGTGGWFAPVSGTYFLYGQAYLDDEPSPYTACCGLGINGGTIMWGDCALSAGNTSDGVCATVRRTLRVQAGSYVEVFASQGSGSTLNVQTTAASHCRFVAVFRGL